MTCLDAAARLGATVGRDHEFGLDLELDVEGDELGAIAAGAMQSEGHVVRHAPTDRRQDPATLPDARPGLLEAAVVEREQVGLEELGGVELAGLEEASCDRAAPELIWAWAGMLGRFS
jgi:hypothetical protein